MSKIFNILIPFVFFVSLTSSVLAEETNGTGSDADFTILYSGNTLEEIKPCGCSKEADLGGLLRRGTAIRKEKEGKEDVFLLDAGDNLKGSNPQGLLKSGLIARGLLLMGYDAVVPGENDFKYGPAFFQAKGFSGWLSSNLVYDKIKFKEVVLKELSQGGRLGIIGLVDESLFENPSHRGISIVSPREFLKNKLHHIIEKNKIDIPILLLHSSKSLALELFKEFQELRIIIVGHTDAPNDETPKSPVIQKGRGLFFADNRGRRLGKIEVKKTFEIDHQWLPLDDSFPDDPDAAPYFAEYKQKVKTQFLKRAEMRKSQKELSPYVSVKECEDCHEEIVTKWRKTRHSRAMDTLKKVGQSYDPECIQCHVVGFEKGGYVSESITSALGGVQCESCHGPARDHLKNVTVKYGNVSKETCKTCHARAKDPRFLFKSDWEKIRHAP